MAGKLVLEARFSQVPNELVHNKDISLKAKGVYAYINSKPDGWEFSVEKIARENRDGVDSVKSAIKELEHHGYLIRRKYQDERGYWCIDYILLIKSANDTADELPVKENPLVENPLKENPSKENPQIIKNSITKTVLNKTININSDNDFEKALISEGADKILAKEYMTVRKKTKGVSTQSAFNSLLSEIKKSGMTINEVLKICSENSWRGFKASWMKNIERKESKTTELNFDKWKTWKD
ncbi:hypothetical protein SAMN05443429_108112 [Cruoricaptor ignavus]|uniref:Helix-turn-helix domain-containing protein n=1 Tax=Cruoricaptor ignavus TaxID=1118202 RepID=A0A1M6GA83_9FLAO|nr:helix-turn-helix domain-containing protein [Cruoricaptor ignavus]SHJ06774.1 hypothetical protein SAMN05443429_108112 [Cruoricaptor ignavus]